MMDRQGFLDALEGIIPSIHFWGLYTADIIKFNGSVQLPKLPTNEDRISYVQFLHDEGIIQRFNPDDVTDEEWKVSGGEAIRVIWEGGRDWAAGWYVGNSPDAETYPYLIYRHDNGTSYVFNPYGLDSSHMWINEYKWEPDDNVMAYLGATLKSETSPPKHFFHYINWIGDPFEEVKG